jgi:hypothetical protein
VGGLAVDLVGVEASGDAGGVVVKGLVGVAALADGEGAADIAVGGVELERQAPVELFARRQGLVLARPVSSRVASARSATACRSRGRPFAAP